MVRCLIRLVIKRRVKSSDILHFKYFTQDGLTGLPPHALRDELKIQQAGNRIAQFLYSWCQWVRYFEGS